MDRTPIFRWIAAILLLLMAGSAAAAPLSFGTDESVPAVVTDTTKPRMCTVAFLVTDVATNDVFVARMQIEPGVDEKPTKNRYGCPTAVPTRVSARAMEACLVRAGDAKLCVFGDMAREFEKRPDARLTAENTSRCASDIYSHIGIACWKSGERDICNVACGGSDQEARDLARGRCEVKQQKRCAITGAAEVLPPQ